MAVLKLNGVVCAGAGHVAVGPVTPEIGRRRTLLQFDKDPLSTGKCSRTRARTRVSLFVVCSG